MQMVRHVFFEGCIAQQLWEYFHVTFELTQANHSCFTVALMQWVLSCPKDPFNHIRCAVPLVVLWCIWRSRNATRFDATLMSSSDIIFQVQHFFCLLGKSLPVKKSQLAGDWDSVFAKFFTYQQTNRKTIITVKWLAPPFGFLKRNTDASVVDGTIASGRVSMTTMGRSLWLFPPC